MGVDKSTVETLIRELGIAEQFVRARELPEWADALQKHQQLLNQQVFERLKYLWRVFAPTCAWDDMSASLSPEDAKAATLIGENVFQSLESLRIELGMEPRSWSYD